MSNHQQYIITGIGTEVGKTVVSAIIAEALSAKYWKPIQAGDLDQSDSIKIENYTEQVTILTEAFRLNHAMSPHAAAEKDGVTISKSDLELPKVEGNLIVEGAGGLMVPINSNGLLFIDLFSMWKLPVILVSRHYLGSINHTLMSVEILQKRNIEIAGIVFIGHENKDTEKVILSVSKCKMITRIPLTSSVDKAFVLEQAKAFTIT
ncbi:MAG: dethiobiotin synthetase [Flavobacteriaceae bacterium]